MKSNYNAISAITCDSPLLYAIERKGIFRTTIQMFDLISTINGKRCSTLISRVFERNPSLESLRVKEFRCNATYEDLALLKVTIPNQLVDMFINELLHAYRYVEFSKPDSSLVLCISMRKVQQGMVKNMVENSRKDDNKDVNNN